jgi:hypothetical protein
MPVSSWNLAFYVFSDAKALKPAQNGIIPLKRHF